MSFPAAHRRSPNRPCVHRHREDHVARIQVRIGVEHRCRHAGGKIRDVDHVLTAGAEATVLGVEHHEIVDTVAVESM